MHAKIKADCSVLGLNSFSFVESVTLFETKILLPHITFENAVRWITTLTSRYFLRFRRFT
jgi:hypothetical protein